MARKNIGTSWNRGMRNALNENFVELYRNVDRNRTEFSNAILQGDSSPLAGQLRVGADGSNFNDPQERLVYEYEEGVRQVRGVEKDVKALGVQVGDNEDKVDEVKKDVGALGYQVVWNKHMVVNGDWTMAIQNALDNHDVVILPDKEVVITRPLYFTGKKTIRGYGSSRSVVRKEGNLKLNTEYVYRGASSGVPIHYDSYDAILISFDTSGDFEVKGAEFIGDEGSPNSYGLLFPYTYRVSLEDLQVKYCVENIRFFQTWNTNFKKVRNRFSVYGLRIEGLNPGTSVEQSTSIHFDNTFSEYNKFGYKLVNVTYFSGSAMSADYSDEVAYWFEYSQGSINGLGVESSKGQFVRNWMSNVAISGMFSLQNFNHYGRNLEAKSKAKIEVWSEDRANTGLTIIGAEFRGDLRGSGDAYMYFVGGRSLLNLINVRDFPITSPLGVLARITEGNGYISEINSEWTSLMSTAMVIDGKSLLEVGGITFPKSVQGYNEDNTTFKTLDGVEHVRTTSLRSSKIEIPIADIRERFPNFLYNDNYLAKAYKFSVYGDAGACVIDNYIIANKLNTTESKTFYGAPHVQSIELRGNLFTITLKAPMARVYVTIQSV